MIGSHNSMSYLPPKNLWGKITRLWNKCQDKTITEQYNNGVDYLIFVLISIMMMNGILFIIKLIMVL